MSAVLIAGCSGDDDEPATVDPAGDPTTADTEPTPDGSDADTAENDEDAGGDAATPGEPLATATMPIAFVDDGELEMAVTGATIQGELLRVDVTLTATVPDTFDEELTLAGIIDDRPGDPIKTISPEVMDTVNLKAYEVLRPSAAIIELRNGRPRLLTYYFGAPQDEMETFDLVIDEKAPPVTDVPLRR